MRNTGLDEAQAGIKIARRNMQVIYILMAESKKLKSLFLKSRDITLPTMVHLVKAMFFPVVMYECESWIIKKAERWRIDAFELWYWGRLLDVKEIKPVHPKENQFWTFIGRTDAEAETPIFWPPDVKNWLTRKDPNAGKDWRWEKKGSTEDEIVTWNHWLNGHEFE